MSSHKFRLFLFVISGCLFLGGCNPSKPVQQGDSTANRPSTAASLNATGGQPASKTSTDVLNTYTLDELQKMLQDRNNKSLYKAEPAEINNIPTAAIADAVISRQKTLYGVKEYGDQRKDYFEIQDPEILKLADSVASVIPTNHLQLSSDSVNIVGQSLGEFKHLCSKESYFSQPVAAGCTAFIVAPDLLATAGHCVDELGSSRIIFGYRELKDASGIHAQLVIPNSQVYKVAQIVAQVGQDPSHPDSSGIDYAVFRVDRPIKDHLPLALDLNGKPTDGTYVYALGHPTGLPLKLAGNATIQNVSGTDYFTANLDTFSGNSGSPVFNTATNRVQGILVRGGTDYRQVGTCQEAFPCPLKTNPNDPDCKGEDATFINKIAPSLGNDVATKALALNPPLIREFRSGFVVSGSGANFSTEYEVHSDPAPQGYKIGGFTYSLVGDRGCNAWSTCKAAIEGDRVVFRFTLQGHNEWGGSGQAKSEGILNVKYIPAD